MDGTESREHSEVSLEEMIIILKRYYKLIIGITVGVSILACLYSLGSLALPPEKSYLPNVYKSQASILVNSSESGGLSSMLASSGLSGVAGIAGISSGSSYGDLALYIATSNPVLDAVIERFSIINRYNIKKSVKTNSRKALKKSYSATYDKKTGILTISFVDRDPEFARDLVNYTIELIDQRFDMIGGNRNLTKKEQLEGKLADVQLGMTRIENEIKKFQQKHGVLTIESAASEQVQTMAQIRSELIMKDMEIQTYGDMSKVQDPSFLKLKAERETLSALLGQLEKGSGDRNKLLPSQQELPTLAVEYAHLTRDLEVQEKVFELLTQQYELTKLQISGSDPILQIIESAEAADMKDGPQRGTMCMIAFFVALIASVFVSFILYRIDNEKTKRLQPESR
jgi:Uncharacterized protein involved in exopolysaccharide biosynthesis